MTSATKARLITAGVMRLREFGYPQVSRENIMTDAVYSQFFKTMLEGTIRDATKHGNKTAVSACRELIDQIGKNAGGAMNPAITNPPPARLP